MVILLRLLCDTFLVPVSEIIRSHKLYTLLVQFFQEPKIQQFLSKFCSEHSPHLIFNVNCLGMKLKQKPQVLTWINPPLILQASEIPLINGVLNILPPSILTVTPVPASALSSAVALTQTKQVYSLPSLIPTRWVLRLLEEQQNFSSQHWLEFFSWLQS